MFYDTKKWKRLREAVLRRDAYMDQMELRGGRRISADTVHHIFPADMYPEYRFCPWNLISLSKRNHELMHNRTLGTLSNIGRRLQMEKAQERGISLNTLTLVIGEPGAGKTTWVQSHLGDGICFDIDYISAAFRLTTSHAERHEQSRLFANRMLKGFVANARQSFSQVFVIRTAPAIEEMQAIDPDRLVVIRTRHNITHRKDYKPIDLEEKRKKIDECVEFARENMIDVTEIG